MRKDSKKNLMLIGCIESKKSGKGMQVIHLTMGIRTGTNWDGKDLKVKVTKKKKRKENLESYNCQCLQRTKKNR